MPLSDDTAQELDRYLAARRQAGAPMKRRCAAAGAQSWRTVSWLHRCGDWRTYALEVIRAAGIRTLEGREPRVHDLRFTFAVQALLRWYRSGRRCASPGTALATYLGMRQSLSTQYYLAFLQATAEAANERFHTHSAAWLLSGALYGRS